LGVPITLGILGGMVLASGVRNRLGSASRLLTIADLSCGAGLASRGLLDGLMREGILAQVVYACDPWQPAVESYRANVPEAQTVEQITTEEALSKDRVPQVDLVLTGPPCIRDSTLARSRSDIALRDDEMAGIKEAAREIALSKGRMVAMETNRGWDSWGRHHGFGVVRVQDSHLGGYTIRRRTFLLKGISPASTEVPLDQRHGWGDALPEWSMYRLGTDVHSVEKRVRLSRPSNEPSHAVVGHGAAPLVYAQDVQIYRCTPEDCLRLQGFDPRQIRLISPLVRSRQTLVGNGWPASYGHWLARSVAETQRSSS
jgi:site-specific DNA-cytosine methylase